MLGSRADAINQTLYKKPLYNLATDFVPVVLIAEQPTVLVARKDLPVDNLQEFIAYAKANQAKMQYGSAGVGSTGHLDCALLNVAIGHQHHARALSRRRAGDAGLDRRPHRLFCTLTGTAVPQIEGKLVKAIAMLTRERSPMLPDLPTAQEQGLPISMRRPGSASSCRRARRRRSSRRLHDAAVEAMDTPSVQERLKEAGAMMVAPERRSPEYLQKFVASEIEKNAAPLKAAGISMD